MSSFVDWLKGEGEAFLGHIIRASALREKRRLQQLDGGLFPHIDHETEDRIKKCEAAADHGKKKIERHAKRTETIRRLSTTIE